MSRDTGVGSTYPTLPNTLQINSWVLFNNRGGDKEGLTRSTVQPDRAIKRDRAETEEERRVDRVTARESGGRKNSETDRRQTSCKNLTELGGSCR